MKSTQYPIAEEFSSIQGEGVYTGTPMRFIRLAGCNVGRYQKDEAAFGVQAFPQDFKIFNTYDYAICESVFGEKFVCDTNYKKKYFKTIGSLLDDTSEEHICITGGEPFLHDLRPLIDAATDKEIMVHIETSGTFDILRAFDGLVSVGNVWITCSPKRGFNRRNMHIVNEWKFVVGPGVTCGVIEKFFEYPQGTSPRVLRRPVFLQPVNSIHRVDPEGLARVLGMLAIRPDWRLSVQLHKILELQ